MCLNEDRGYKRGVARPKWRSKKIWTCTKHGRLNVVRTMSNNQPKLHTLELFSTQNIAIQPIYTNVDTVARANTYDSCFRPAIVNTKSDRCQTLPSQTR